MRAAGIAGWPDHARCGAGDLIMRRLSLSLPLLFASCSPSPAYAGVIACTFTGMCIGFLVVVCLLTVALVGAPPSLGNWRQHGALAVFAAMVVALLLAVPKACAAEIPTAAHKYHRDLVRLAHTEMGLDAPVATLAAQIHQESGWNPSARSPVGALGLSQFMPGTSAWIAGWSAALSSNQPLNPVWAMRGMIVYDQWHLDRLQARGPCDKWAKALSAYNGGLGWVQKDTRLALAKGANPLAWFNSVERYNSGRSTAAFKENRDYPRKILLRWEPLYVGGGWGDGVCT